ncbi:fimbrial protein [Burkholderia ambifaria]|uniref:Fimbrial protein n=1 Tax=Burkholderia ambifaria IOP40-10 TaxID=396596 RepID=B1F803_9BURK|nr:fimbrial protein [Burkholderia ambifaria]EDT06410.1 Fimbrial protein [Burkholderia ambifaria IOP40-10]
MKWMNTARNANLRASNRSAIRRAMQCLALCTIAFSEFAFAACALWPTGYSIRPTLPGTVSVTQDEIALGVKFPNSTADGENAGSVAVNDVTQTCRFDEFVFTPIAKVIPNVTYKTSNGKTAAVFETGIPGIGFVVEVQTLTGGDPLPEPLINGDLSFRVSARDRGSIYARVTLVSAGGLVTGTWTSKTIQLFSFRLKYQGAFLPGSSRSSYMSSISTNVTARACKVTSGATNSVTLPTLVAASLKATGDVASARSAPFSIGLNCDANVNVHATLTDATNPANTGSALSLAPSSTAAGVGIQILKKGESTPLSFGPDSSGKGNTNQWLVGKSSAANTKISVPFEARYVKVAEKIKPGSVSALSTITFSYQ